LEDHRVWRQGGLREAEVLLTEGVSVGKVVRRLGVTQVTYYRWPKEYGGMKVDQAKRLKELEKENARLVAMAGQAGFRCFRGADEFQRYIEREITIEAAL